MAHKEDISKQESKLIPSMDGLADAAKVVQDAAERLIEFSKDAAGDASDEIRHSAKIAVKKSTSLIKKHPLESALVCFGVGVVAGMLINNRD